jgi:hypothetical protein
MTITLSDTQRAAIATIKDWFENRTSQQQVCCPGESGEASCGEEACEEVVVPCGDFAFEAQ